MRASNTNSRGESESGTELSHLSRACEMRYSKDQIAGPTNGQALRKYQAGPPAHADHGTVTAAPPTQGLLGPCAQTAPFQNDSSATRTASRLDGSTFLQPLFNPLSKAAIALYFLYSTVTCTWTAGHLRRVCNCEQPYSYSVLLRRFRALTNLSLLPGAVFRDGFISPSAAARVVVCAPLG